MTSYRPRKYTEEWRIPLVGATVTSPVRYGPSMVVRQATALEIQRWSEWSDVRDYIPHKVFSYMSVVLVCRRSDAVSEDDLLRDLTTWFAVTTLYANRPAPLDAAFMEQWLRKSNDRIDRGQWRGWMELSLSLPIAFSPFWQGPIHLRATATPVRKALREFRRVRPAFHYALSRWFQSLNRKRRTLEDAVVDLSIGAEAIFILEEEREDKERLLRERMTRYWFKYDKTATKSTITKFTRRISSMYDVRSKIVHGIVPKGLQARKAREFLDAVLREIFVDVTYGRLRSFDPRRL